MSSSKSPAFWLPFLISVFVSGSSALKYSSLPGNMSQVSGKPVSLICGVSPNTSNPVLNFTIYGVRVNSTLKCPGPEVFLSGQGIRGYCETRYVELCAVWSMSSTMLEDNGTYVVCQGTDLQPIHGFLTVYENSSYFAILLGCVIGGFFGILLFFGLAFILLNHSERFQKCFKGRTPHDDITTIVEEYKTM